jgi:PAS domain S-box-containing protein
MSAAVQSEARILCADDTDAQRYAVSRVLRGAGFEVIEARTGRQALDMMQAHPDLVVLDVNLPDLSGFEVCRQIKACETTARIPILHVSATVVSTGARVTGLEGGADAYLIQPIAPEELIATIRALLRVRRAEEALWRSHQQYRQFFEATPLPCVVFDISDLRVLAVNAAAVAKYGYSREEFTAMNLRNIVADESWPSLSNHRQEASLAAHSAQLQRHSTKDGSLLDVEVSWASLSLDDRDARLVIVQDITEKLKRESAEKNEAIRRLLLERILQAQEEERQKISRELHDETGQLMTSLLIGLRSLSDARRLSDARQQAQRLREIASQAIGELSRLARGLHSSILDDLGLEAALRRFADDFSATHHIHVNLDLRADQLVALSKHAQLNLYRIIQEALTNVARHAQAKCVCIKFDTRAAELHVSIRDDGRGLPPLAQSSDPAAHLGIEGMRQRAAILGGILEVLSEPQQGVAIELSIPINKTTAADWVA